MISKGNKFPLFNYLDRKAGEFVKIDLNSEMKGKTTLIFGLPGAFTPTCSSKQLPGYESLFNKFNELGVNEIYCTSVNDPFTMNAWFDNQNIQNVRSLPDGNGDLAQSLGMFVSKKNLNFGMRSWRYALLVGADNKVIEVFAEPEKRDMADDDSYTVSTPEAVLKWLQANPQN
jgi:peroxiredoxin